MGLHRGVGVPAGLGLALGLILAGCAADSTAAIDTAPTAATDSEPTTAGDMTVTTVEIQPPRRQQTTTTIGWVGFEQPVTIPGYTPAEDPKLDRLAPLADAAVWGQIVAIGPGDYLVPASTLAEFDGSRAVLARETTASIFTPVVIRVHDVLAVRPDLAVDLTPGHELAVQVSGGTVEFVVTPEDAERTGLRPDVSHEEEQADIDAGIEPPPGPGPVPEQSFMAGASQTAHVSLAEGQEVIAFLRWGEWYDPVANDGSTFDDLKILLSLDYTGAGLFVRQRDSSALTIEAGAEPFTHAATLSAVDADALLDAAAGIEALTGPATVPQWQAPTIYGD